MGIKRITPKSDIDDFISQHILRTRDKIIYNLRAVGETCVNIGRSTDSYKDQTGNLRNSIGYVIVSDGRVIQQSLTHENRGQGGALGSKSREEFISELVGKCGKGIYLIVVAGMSYSSYVSAKGMDVLDSAELQAQKLMSQFGFTKK